MGVRYQQDGGVSIGVLRLRKGWRGAEIKPAFTDHLTENLHQPLALGTLDGLGTLPTRHGCRILELQNTTRLLIGNALDNSNWRGRQDTLDNITGFLLIPQIDDRPRAVTGLDQFEPHPGFATTEGSCYICRAPARGQ